MAPPSDALSKVVPEREAWRLRVRILRLWKVPSFNNSKLPNSIEMLLLDEFGGKIQASVRKTLVYKFLNVLTEGNVYKMCYFTVIPNVGAYRATDHEFRLIFQYRTTVALSDSVIIPQYGLSFIPFGDVLGNEGDSDFLIDVMGLLVGTSNQKEYDRHGKTTKMVIIELSDCNVKLECALFAEYVDQLNAFLTEGNADLPVVVIQLAKVKLFRGKIVIQTVMYSSKIMLNLPIAEVVAFRQCLAEDGTGGCQPLAIIPNHQTPSVEEDFMQLHQQKFIDQITECKQDGFFIVLATVTAIVDNVDWWYSACKCQRSVSPDSGIYYCDVCLCHVVSVTPRYKIKLKVCDGTGSAVFVLFDCDSQHLLKTPCSQLLAECNKLGGGSHVPHVISSLVGQKLLFKVQTKLAISSHYDGSFCVRRVCNDEHMLGMFMLPGADNTPTKAIFTSSFPNTVNLGDDVVDCEIIPSKPFDSQMIVSPIPLSSHSSFCGGKATPVKKRLYDTIEPNRDSIVGSPLKAVKIEKD